ncbi:MAG: DUF882 domain-containing protein [Bradyrhizobiaceae bacterium]|nr:MAG: DUF882 domain-containing protein [Bradyrhizobiaceae bacterium]
MRRRTLRHRAHATRLGLATLLVFAGAGSVHDASAYGDTRTLSFHHTHSGEDLTVTFKRNGRYDEEALKTLNHYLRDWRTQDQTVMDRHLFDILWEVYRDVDGKQPIQIISSYRSPATNAMLRHRSAHSGVARFSQHMLGHAMDFFIPGVPLEQIRFAGLRLQRGGVGFYPTSGSPFVHLDTGNVRHWPRMTHDQLVRLFPDGKTVLIPSDGKPLPGYELAMAEIQSRKGDEATIASKPSLFAGLFRSKQADDDDESAPAASPDPAKDPAKPSLIASAAAKVKEKLAEAVPLPRAKPVRTATYQVASAAPQDTAIKAQPASFISAAPADVPRAPTASDIINARIAWDDSSATPKQATPQQIAALAARRANLADPASTASLPKNVANAMAYAAPATLLDRTKVVAASAPIPVGSHIGSIISNPMSVNIKTIVAKALPGRQSTLTTMARVASSPQMNDIWLRAMILTPDVSGVLSVSVLADQDMTVMSAHFVKPAQTVTMTFSEDPSMGLPCDHFTGSAIATLAMTSFDQQTAEMR